MFIIEKNSQFCDSFTGAKLETEIIILVIQAKIFYLKYSDNQGKY